MTPPAAPGETAAGIPPDLLEELEAIPYDVRLDPRAVWFITKGAVDLVAHNLPRVNRLLVRLNPYPKPWERVRIAVDDAGTELGGWYAEGRSGAPAVLYALGTFQTKDDTPRKARAIGMWRDLGWSVLALDLRGFGESHESWGTGGYLESRDLHAAARWLRERVGTARVALVGESLGGAASLIAASLPGAPDLFSSVMAWSPFADAAEQTKFSTTNPGLRHPGTFMPYAFYRMMLMTRAGRRYRDFNEYLDARARELGLDANELLRRSSSAHHAADVAVPTLVHHAEDDPVVPVQQALILQVAAAGNPFVRVRVLPRGGHGYFGEVAPSWYWSTMRTFIERLHRDVPRRFTLELRRGAEEGVA